MGGSVNSVGSRSSVLRSSRRRSFLVAMMIVMWLVWCAGVRHVGAPDVWCWLQGGGYISAARAWA